MRHLRSNPFILAAVVAVSRAVSRCGVRKLAGEDQTGRFAIELFGRFEHRGQRLVGTGRVGRIDVVVTVPDRIGRNVTGTAGLSGHVARSGGSRVTDRSVGRMGAYGSAQIGVDVQLRLVGMGVPLQPASHGDGCPRCSVRNHHNYIFDRLDLFEVGCLSRHDDGCQEQQKSKFLFHNILLFILYM